MRELRNCIERALVMGEGRLIEVEDFPVAIRSAKPPAHNEDPYMLKLPAHLDVIERHGIDAALLASGGNGTQAAALLGITRQTLWRSSRPPGPTSQSPRSSARQILRHPGGAGVKSFDAYAVAVGPEHREIPSAREWYGAC